MPFVEFGTRRRFSFENQERVVGIMRGCPNFKGTSNIFLAMKYGIPVKGTVSHEWFQFHSAKYGYILANKIAMELWLRVFNGKLAVVLPDTFTSKVFLRSFDSHLVNAYDGIRQDSGYHADFINLFYGFYKSCGIDPMTKICMFSDGIDSIQTIKDIQNACFGKFVPSAGIGTWLTNDCGVPPLDMVIKMNSVFNGDKEIPVVKLSDTPGKNSGDPDEVLRCKKEFGIL
jgi:nicotinate phosphoribosyltransferase